MTLQADVTWSCVISGTDGGGMAEGAQPAITQSLPNAKNLTVEVTLAVATFTQIPIPAGTSRIKILPVAGATGTLTQKGITGDTGWGLSITNDSEWNITGISPAPTSLGLVSSAGMTVRLLFL
jgi:hypothetical protein